SDSRGRGQLRKVSGTSRSDGSRQSARRDEAPARDPFASVAPVHPFERAWLHIHLYQTRTLAPEARPFHIGVYAEAKLCEGRGRHVGEVVARQSSLPVSLALQADLRVHAASSEDGSQGADHHQ